MFLNMGPKSVNLLIQTAKITPCYCRHLVPLKEGKFGAVFALDGSNNNYQTRQVSNLTTNS